MKRFIDCAEYVLKMSS